MKKFLSRLFLSLLPIFVYWISVAIYNIQNFINNPLITNNNVLILGDSHAQYAINDKLLPSAANYSQAAEPLVLSYWKLKYLLKNNHPDTIIISFAPHSISRFRDLAFTHERWRDEILKRSFLIGEVFSIENLQVDYWCLFKICLKQILIKPNNDLKYFIGAFEEKRGTHLGDSLESIRRHYYFESVGFMGISNVSIHYLDSIHQTCVNNGIHLVLTNHPLHESYFKRIPLEIYNKFIDLEGYYKKKGVTILDYSKHQFPDSLFFNSDHLNGLGAIGYTNLLKRDLYNKK